MTKKAVKKTKPAEVALKYRLSHEKIEVDLYSFHLNPEADGVFYHPSINLDIAETTQRTMQVFFEWQEAMKKIYDEQEQGQRLLEEKIVLRLTTMCQIEDAKRERAELDKKISELENQLGGVNV